MDRWMGRDVWARDLVIRERLDALRAEAARERLLRSTRSGAGDAPALRVRVGIALVRAGTALAGECAVSRLIPRHP